MCVGKRCHKQVIILSWELFYVFKQVWRGSFLFKNVCITSVAHAIQVDLQVGQMRYSPYLLSVVFPDVLQPKTMATVYSISINTWILCC